MNYYMLKEYKRQNKCNEYMRLKKELVEILRSKGWKELSGKLLVEDRDFVASRADSATEALAIQMQIDELAISKGIKEHEGLFA